MAIAWSLVGGGILEPVNDSTVRYRPPTSVTGIALVIGTAGGQRDTTLIRFVSGGGTLPGTPYGHYNAWTLTSVTTGAPFTMGMGNTQPLYLPALLANLADRNLRLVVNLFGGGAESYLTNGAFDLAKWRAQLRRYDGLRSLIRDAHAGGQLVGLLVMDEPHNPKWGGIEGKAVVDGMCAETQAMFPGVPVGVTHQHDRFDPERPYRVCDFLIDQYVHRKGDAQQYLADALAYARRDGIALVFSLNILDGGIQAERDGRWACSLATTGGRGTFDPNCRMTPEQIRAWGRLFGPQGCALLMWRREDDVMRNSDYQQAFATVAGALALPPLRSCRRPL